MSTTPLTDAVQHGPAAGSFAAMTDHARDLEEQLAFIRRCCRVVYYPPDGSCPIEHAPGAGKDQLDEILRRKEPAMNDGSV